MSGFSFGFGKGNGGNDDGGDDASTGGSGSNPFAGGPFGDMSAMPFFGDIQKLFTAMSSQTGPVNWDVAKQLATSQLSQSSTIVSPAERSSVAEALRLADHWLDDATDLPSGISSIESWSRLEWFDRTTAVWVKLCEPVAARVTAAMGNAIPGDQLEALGALGNLGLGGQAGANPLQGMLNQFGGLMFGAQVGQGLAGLAGEVVSATDIGIPLGPKGVAALVPANVAAFGEGLERPAEEVLLYLALREAAHQRLFAHVPWLTQRLLDTVDGYARGISIDTGAIESALQNIDPTNPQAMQEALGDGLFTPQNTPDQQAALRRLETLLALVEGWVDAVVAAAAGTRMPGADALREASRRRRATGGPAEQTFATLVGLELRPRRLREAAALWWSVTEKRGISGRDGVWDHPDLMPTAEDLDDPLGFGDTVAGYSAPDDLSGLETGETPRDDAGDSSDGTPDDASGDGPHTTGAGE